MNIKTIFEIRDPEQVDKILKEIDCLCRAAKTPHVHVYKDIKPIEKSYDGYMVRGGEKLITLEFSDMKTYVKFTKKLNKALTDEKENISTLRKYLERSGK